MRRREFLAKSCMAGVASLAGAASVANGQRLPGETDAAYRIRIAREREAEAVMARRPGETDAAYRARTAQIRAASGVVQTRQYYELRRYEIETEEQKAGFDKFAAEAMIPAANRLGIEPVGVFYRNEGLSPICVLLPHKSLYTFATFTQRLSEDEKFLEAGADFVNAPAHAPAYQSLEVQLMVAFEGMAKLETPVDAPGRIFQLRTYESPSTKTGQKKIEMFNTAEIAIFRKVGLHPVFFGETLAGTKMPNLTYMLAFQDMEESRANWKQFGADPDWQKLRAIPEYADKEILRQKGITNLYLKPASYSQI